MSAHLRSLAHRAVVSTLVLAAAASAGAQQVPEARFARATTPASTDPATVAAPDSAARYLRLARAQRRSGASFVIAGLGAAAAAYVQYARGGRMGMSGGQIATFAAGAALGGVGASRIVSAREHLATSQRWELRR